MWMRIRKIFLVLLWRKAYAVKYIPADPVDKEPKIAGLFRDKVHAKAFAFDHMLSQDADYASSSCWVEEIKR